MDRTAGKLTRNFRSWVFQHRDGCFMLDFAPDNLVSGTPQSDYKHHMGDA